MTRKNAQERSAAPEPAQSEWASKQIVPVADIEKYVQVGTQVEDLLKSDPTHAYSISALLIPVFGLKEGVEPESQLNGTFTAKTNQVRAVVRKLIKKGLVAEGRHGPTKVYYYKSEAAASSS